MRRLLLLALALCVSLSAQTIISATAGDTELASAYHFGANAVDVDHPDPGFCAGVNHVMEFNGAKVVIRAKSNLSSAVSRTAQNTWWAAVTRVDGGSAFSPTETLHDPRCYYDVFTARWIVANNDANGAGTGSGLWIAISSGSDPTTSTWKGFGLNASSTPALPTTIDELIHITSDVHGIYFSGADGGGSAPNTDQLLIAFPSADLAATTPVLTHGVVFTRMHHESFVVTDLNPSKSLSSPVIFIGRAGVAQNGSGCTNNYQYAIRRFHWSNSTTFVRDDAADVIADPSQTFCATITAGVSQPGSSNKIKTSESHRLGDSFASSDSSSIWVVGGQANSASTNGVYWAQIGSLTTTPAVIQAGIIDGSGASPAYSVIHPAGVLDASGNFAILATKVSTSEYPSTYIWAHLAGDSAGTLRSPVLAYAGTQPYNSPNNPGLPSGWGVYGSSALDPSDGTLWGYNQVALSATTGQWATGIVNFRLQSPSSGWHRFYHTTHHIGGGRQIR